MLTHIIDLDTDSESIALIDTSPLDSRYLKLDCSNDPLTENLQLQKGGDNLHLYIDVHSLDNTDYPRLYFRKSDHNTAGVMSTTDSGDWLGNIKYLGVNDSSQFAGGAYLTVKQTDNAGAYIPSSIEWATYSAIGANANSLVIDNSGNVGFGEATPISSLEITKATPGLTLHNTTAGDGDGDRASFIAFRGHQSGDEESMLAKIEASHNGAGDDENGILKFYVNEDGTSYERMSINSAGQVQIGSLNFDTNTITSDTDLISLNSDSLININALNFATNTANYFLMADGTYYNPTSPADVRTGLGLTSGGAGDIWVEKAGDTMTGVLNISEIRAKDGDGLKLYDDGGNGIFVDDGGKVGIGTTSPSQKLEVTGRIYANSTRPILLNAVSGTVEIKGSAAGWIDGLKFVGNSDTSLGGFMAYGSGDSLNYYYIGDSYTSPKMIIKDGNVGIGVTDPDTKLEVFNAGNQLKLSFDATDNAIFAVDTSGNLTITPSGTGLILKGASDAVDPRLTFDSGNDGYIEWQEDELQFHIEGAIEMGGDWTFVGGSFFPRAVDDAGMDETDGTEGEIVYNQDDNGFWGCTVTGTPATWSAFN